MASFPDSPYSHSSEQVIIDTSSPFSSVKQAVAVYGERFLERKLVQSSPEPVLEIAIAGDEVYNDEDSDKQVEPVSGEAAQQVVKRNGAVDCYESEQLTGKSTDDYDDKNDEDGDGRDVRIVHHHHHTTTTPDYRHYDTLITIFKKLEVQLADAKREMKSLRDRDSENEVALASMKAELHKCMSKIAKMEATEAANYTKNTASLMRSNTSSFDSIGSSQESRSGIDIQERRRLLLEPKVTTTTTTKENEHQQLLLRQTTISDILSYGDVCEGSSNSFTMKQHLMVAKRKPIVPLLTDIFFVCGGGKKKIPSSSSVHLANYKHKDYLSLIAFL